MLEEFFDIAHLNVLDMMKINEDSQFLLLYRQPDRAEHMSEIDNKQTKLTKNLKKRRQYFKKFRRATKEKTW